MLSELTALVATLLTEVTALRTELQAHMIERYYDLPTAADLLGCPLGSLRDQLKKYQARLALPVYRFDSRHLRHRMLPASDVRLLQSLRVRSRLHDGRLAA